MHSDVGSKKKGAVHQAKTPAKAPEPAQVTWGGVWITQYDSKLWQKWTHRKSNCTVCVNHLYNHSEIKGPQF